MVQFILLSYNSDGEEEIKLQKGKQMGRKKEEKRTIISFAVSLSNIIKEKFMIIYTNLSDCFSRSD